MNAAYRENNLNLDHIKLVIFDFDGTLAIHKNKDFLKHRNESEEKRQKYYLNAYKNPDIFYEEIEPCDKSEVLYNFVNGLRNKNIKMYCLSGMKFSFNLKAKQSFINKHYGNDIEVVSVGSQQLKLDGIKILAKANNCSLDKILFIEDLDDTVNYLKENGIYAVNVNDIKGGGIMIELVKKRES